MSEHKNIATALASAQSNMGAALKDSSNPAFKSKYADLASVMGACMPALSAAGIAVIQPTTDDEIGRYVKTMFIHGASGEVLECRVPLIVNKNDMQGYGSAVTYARRYGLMSMAGIAPEDDDGNAAAKAPPIEQLPRAVHVGPTAMDVACDSLGNSDTLEQLQAIWKDLPKSVAGERRVIEAKDAAKARLAKTADVGGDQIPY